MSNQVKPSNSTAGDDRLGPLVPVRWLILGAGVIVFILGLLSRFDLLPMRAGSEWLGAFGIAMIVGGYILCFIIPPLEQRVQRLEKLLKDREQRAGS